MKGEKSNCAMFSFSSLVFLFISNYNINFTREEGWGGSPDKILQWFDINIFTTKMFIDIWKVPFIIIVGHLSITKYMCISHWNIWHQRPLFTLQTHHALFSLEISKTCFAIYIINLYIFIPLRIAQTSTFPPPLMSYQWKLIKNAWLSFGGMVLFIRKKKKKRN